MMMKIFSLFVLAIPTAAFAASASSGGGIEDNHLPSVLFSSSDWLPSKVARHHQQLYHEHHHQHDGDHRRNLQAIPNQRRRTTISEGCENAILALEDDAALSAAEAKKEEEFDAIDADDACTVSGNSVSCKFDLTKLPSHNEYVDACKAASGRLVDFDFSLNCKDSGDTFHVAVSDDTCLPNVCTDDEYEEIVEEVEQILGDLFADGLEGTGATCTVSSAFGLLLSVVTTTSLLVITTFLTM